MRNIFFAALLAASITLLATARTQNQQAGTMQNCPMKLAGTEISAANTDNGIAVTLTTKSGDVAELRRRVENMAKMHTSPNMHGNGIAFSSKYEEVPEGARLTLTPNDPAKLDEFRTEVREHVEQMKKGECRMMQDMMHGRMHDTMHHRGEKK